MRRFEFECQNCGWKTENIGEKHFCPKDEKNKVDGTYGIQCHADRLSKLHEALVAAVEALEESSCECEEANHVTGLMKKVECYRCHALSKIDKVLEEK